ncbi:DUF2157 domain-containing protein [Archangium primigenium]|uniref:DUF2157 domain-containing protein n=1 Tax=[Archangium] primigenium TaxID=2792470 RepID=UPI00195B64D8|nr:DUF2157 domain-containing protein [Archangium primigenium]
MSSDPLDLAATPERLYLLADAGVLSPPELKQALGRAVQTPAPPAWQRFLSIGLMGFGSLLVLSGVIYFFAYNWAALHRFGKLGLLLAAIAGACVAATQLKDGLPGQFALLFAAVLVGPLLAVYGQAYQTGADPYGLFLGWGLLILPWVALARFGPLWLLLLVLVDTGLSLYRIQALGREDALLVLMIGLLNGAAWAVHEVLALRGVESAQGRWLPRVLAAMTILPLLGLAAHVVFEPQRADASEYVALVLVCALVAATYFFHRRVRPELFLLTLGVLSVMTLVTTFAGRIIFEVLDAELFGIFLMAAVLIGELSAAAWWLRTEAQGAEDV